MIKSKFIKSILDLLLDGDEFGHSTRPQMDFLTESNYDYTGVGLFVRFTHSEQADNYKSQNENIVLDGVNIKSDELEHGAYTVLHFKNGIIDNLEICSFSGDYPKKELTNYLLTQEWNGSAGRQISSDENNTSA